MATYNTENLKIDEPARTETMNNRIISVIVYHCCHSMIPCLLIFIAFLYPRFTDAQFSLDSFKYTRDNCGVAEWNKKVYIIGGYEWNNAQYKSYFVKTVNVFNVSTMKWESPLEISAPRQFITCIGGDSGFYAVGGTDSSGKFFKGSNRADIYRNGTFSTRMLSHKVYGGSAVKVGRKLLFTGFRDSQSKYTSEVFASDLVYIYDEPTDVWSTARLSQARTSLGVAANDSVAIFAGGLYGLAFTSDVVDIYNANTNTWSTSRLSSPRALTAGAHCNGKFYFAGGCAGRSFNTSSDIVDVYQNGIWSKLKLSQPRANMSAAVVANHIFFMNGGDQELLEFRCTASYHTIDVLNTLDNTWGIMRSPLALESAASVVVGDKIISGGGKHQLTFSDGNRYMNSSKFITILDASLIYLSSRPSEQSSISIYPNPSSGTCILTLPRPNARVTVSDLSGAVISDFRVSGVIHQLEINRPGVFLIRVTDETGTYTTRAAVTR